MSNYNFAALILSHGRADNVKTVKAMTRAGYTGRWYLIIDNEDNQIDQYINNFGVDHIIVFDKAKSIKNFDIMDNFEGRAVPVFARNVLYEVSEQLGLDYFLELEDDYFNFSYRYLNANNELHTLYVREMDKIIEEMFNFLENTNSHAITFSQGGDFIGGANSQVFKKRLSRKAMQSFFCKVDRPFKFLGRFNDDVNSYVDNGKTGKLLFTIADIMLYQPETQKNSGGITETYKKYGTYVKSFYSVILAPSCVKITTIGSKNTRRIHHKVLWDNAVPQIINQKYKKVI